MAKKIVEALKDKGFTITQFKDPERNEILGAIIELEKQLTGSKSNGAKPVGFVYFAGAGGAEFYDDINYLLPANIDSFNARNLREKAIPLHPAFGRLSRTGARLLVMVIDGCVADLIERSDHKGFFGYKPPLIVHKNSILVFACSPGTLAGKKIKHLRSAPTFAKLLAGRLPHDESIDKMFSEISKSMIGGTKGSQLSEMYVGWRKTTLDQQCRKLVCRSLKSQTR